MGGSGDSGSYSPSADVARLRREALKEVAAQELLYAINVFLDRILAEINTRDIETTGAYLEALLEMLHDDVEDVDRLLFGGSVAKHTYVDGLSDIDCLVILDRAVTDSVRPANLREDFAQIIRERGPAGDIEAVSVGDLAVTVMYRDGTTIQLLPAARDDEVVFISSPDGASWQRIKPRDFARRLTEVNQANGGGVVPTIKLAKAILATLPPERQLSGYHTEALAVAAFRAYDGPRNRVDMLRHFFSSAAQDVLRPIPDVTGQSAAVDAALGPANSPERRRIADSIARVARIMESVGNLEQWQGLFGE